ncbi:MAG: hypothetical protein QXG98_02060 [Candidatus Micrarchaeia archaeon]
MHAKALPAIILLAFLASAAYHEPTQPAPQEEWLPLRLLVETGAVHALAIIVSLAGFFLALLMRNAVGKMIRPTYTWTAVGLFFLMLTHFFHYLLLFGLQENPDTIVLVEHFFHIAGVSSILYGLWRTYECCRVG